MAGMQLSAGALWQQSMRDIGGGLISRLPGTSSVVRHVRREVVASASPSSDRRVALVTGANKGIGKEIARRLGSTEGLAVVLGCRNKELGAAAAAELSASSCDVVFQELDLTDAASIAAMRCFLDDNFEGRLDVLVNNAAICFNDPTLYGKVPHTPFAAQAGITVDTNFFGTLRVTQACLPLLRAAPSPRIVNVASAAGRLSILPSPDKVATFTSETLELEELEELMRQFVKDVESGVHAREGWPNTCYGMSKLGVIALTRLLAREEPHMMVNSVDPGYCATDQNNHKGTVSAERGAMTPAWLATLPEERFVTGKHFYDGREISWTYK